MATGEEVTECGEERVESVEIREDSRIVRKQNAEIEQIRSLLQDVYKDAGDGRTVVRELIQNADDAGAEHLTFLIVDRGWEDATNPLLRGPSLVIANDGAFDKEHQDGLHAAMGGSKQGDQDKVGRFGLGMKSLFHLCEAFCYVGKGHATGLRAGVLNPWAGTGDSDGDPLHPEWDRLPQEDAARLVGLARNLLSEPQGYLLLWIPLRTAAHMDRYEGEKRGITMVEPTPGQVDFWFERIRTLNVLLAQCGALRRITVRRGTEAGTVEVPRWSLERSGGSLGRPKDWPTGAAPTDLSGEIRSTDHWQSTKTLQLSGIEFQDKSPELLSIYGDPGWPKDEVSRNGHMKREPRKARPHVAITTLPRDMGEETI